MLETFDYVWENLPENAIDLLCLGTQAFCAFFLLFASVYPAVKLIAFGRKLRWEKAVLKDPGFYVGGVDCCSFCTGCSGKTTLRVSGVNLAWGTSHGRLNQA